MGMTRCTCIYRLVTDPERAGYVVASADPWCPAADVHARTAAAPEPTPNPAPN